MVVGEVRDVTSNARGKGAVQGSRDVTDSAEGKGSLGRDMFLITVQEGNLSLRRCYRQGKGERVVR